MPITEPGASRHFLEVGNACFPLQQRFEVMDSGIHDRWRRLEAIDRYPWTGRVTVRLRQVKNRRAIGQMITRDAVGPGGLLHVPKEGNLLASKSLVRFRSQREMAHEPPHRNSGEITTPGE